MIKIPLTAHKHHKRGLEETAPPCPNNSPTPAYKQEPTMHASQQKNIFGLAHGKHHFHIAVIA